MSAADVVMVGGVPGAGKTTALRRLAAESGVRVLDPETARDWFRRNWPSLPYARYRWLVHTLHTARVLTAVLRGPVDDAPLFVHDPATRPRRRRWFARLARSRGWRPQLLLIDVERAEARQGQLRRGRVVGTDCFDGHWQRWARLRAELDAGHHLGDAGIWETQQVVTRDTALPVLQRLLAPAPLNPVVSSLIAEEKHVRSSLLQRRRRSAPMLAG